MSVRKNASYNLIGSAIPLLLALFTIPTYIGLIGIEKYGILSLAFLFLGYFGLFDLGLGKATTFRVAALADSTRQRQADVVSTALIMNLVMGAIGAGFVWLASAIFFENMFPSSSAVSRSEIQSALPLLSLALPLSMITGVLTGALQGRELFTLTNSVSVLSTTVFQVVPIIVAAFYTDSLPALLAAALVSRLLALMVLVEISRRVFFRGVSFRWQRHEVRLLFGFGGWILADGLLTPALAMFDRFAIGAILGGASVAIYTVPYQLAQRVTILPSALLSAIFPKLPTAGSEARDRYAESSLHFLLAALTPPVVGCIAFLEPAFRIWLGDAVGPQSARVGSGILMAFWINALAWVPFVLLQGVGRPAEVTKAHIAELVPYFAVLFTGLYMFGIIGAVVALIFRNLLDLLLLMKYSNLIKKVKDVVPFLILVTASVVMTSFSGINQLSYWSVHIVILVAATALSWLTLPIEMRSIVMRRASRIRGLSGE